MKLFKFLINVCIPFFFILFLHTQNAYAYLDLGTGSYFFQIIISFIVGGLFSIKLFWKKIKNKFLKIEKK